MDSKELWLAEVRREELAEALSASLKDFLLSERQAIIARFKTTPTLTTEELSELRIELNLLDKFHNKLMSQVADSHIVAESLQRINEVEERLQRELDQLW